MFFNARFAAPGQATFLASEHCPCMNALVVLQRIHILESFWTKVTLVIFNRRVNALMSLQVRHLVEVGAAHLALERFSKRVHHLVHLSVFLGGEGLVTASALEGFNPCMPALVVQQSSLGAEPFVTEVAGPPGMTVAVETLMLLQTKKQTWMKLHGFP